MAKAPLFSTYRAGENRVTSSMLAVFERIDFGLVESILSAAESELQLLRFSNQVVGSESIPDAEISAAFRYLFEVKTVPGALGADQLQRHLRLFDGRYSDERLFALTPDLEEPPAVRECDDARVVWMSFRSLAQAMEGELAAAAGTSEREAFLLRELLRLFEEEQLLGYPEDVVVVPARDAYDEYLRDHLYVCQARRSFRSGLAHLAFYRDRRIEPLVPRILARRQDVEVSAASVERLRRAGSPEDLLIADAVETAMRTREDPTLQIFVLSAPDAVETIALDGPITHDGRGAWTQYQRYLSSDALRNATTTEDLA
jgi:hypothetical protein